MHASASSMLIPTRREFLAIAASAWPTCALAQNIGATDAPSGRIAFASGDFTHSNRRKIWIIQADGLDLRPLTENSDAPGEDRPSWSPDGKRIAFSAIRDGATRIYVREADGTHEECLTSQIKYAAHPVWSPDGAKIAYCGQPEDADGASRIFMVQADGGRPTQITFGGGQDWMPSWFPDSESLAFESTRDGNREIYVVNVDGTGINRITKHEGTDHAPSVAPDGAKIAFMTGREYGSAEICVMGIDGNNITNLTKNAARDSEPAWSPDSKWIAFTRSSGTGDDFTMELWTMKADGSGPRMLTRSEKGVHNWAPAWG